MNLTGFLYGGKARLFMKELWNHLSSAQESVSGIPVEFLEEKKEEIRQMKVQHNHGIHGLVFFFSFYWCDYFPDG